MRTKVNPPCNGWAVVKKEYFTSPSAKNIHVVEVRIESDINGHVTVYPNPQRTSCCGKMTLKEKWSYDRIFTVSEDYLLRNYLAQCENTDNETCGICTSHFYADVEA